MRQYSQIQFEIRLCESGVKHQLTFDLLSRVKDLQQKIQSEYKIQINDQILLTKNGYILKPEDQIRKLDIQKDKTYAADNSNDLKRIICIHVYSRKSLKSQEKVKIPTQDDINNELRSKCKQRACLNIKSEFKLLEQVKTREEIYKLQELNPHIADNVKTIIKYDDKLLSTIHEYQMLRMFTTEQNEQIGTQYKSCSVLFSSLKNSGNNIKNQSSQLIKNIEEVKKKKQQNLKSLEELKKVYIDKKYLIEGEVNKTLYEAVFNTQNTSQSNQTNQLIETYYLRLLQIKKKIQAQVLAKVTADRNFRCSKMSKKDPNIDTKVQAFSAPFCEIKSDREKLVRIIFDHINKYLKNQNDVQSKEFLIGLKKQVDSISAKFKENLKILQEENNYFIKNYITFEQWKIKNQNCYKEAYINYEMIEGMFESMCIDMNEIKNKTKGIQKQIDEVWNVEFYKKKYNDNIDEINARIKFCQKMKMLDEEGNRLFNSQQERRIQYNNRRAKSKTPQIFSFLSQASPARLLLQENDDSKLSKLPVFKSIKTDDYENFMFKNIQELTTNIGDYRRHKQNLNYLNSSSSSIINPSSNLEQILIKSTKICYKMYQNKLKEEVEKYQSTIYSMSELRTSQQAAIKILKDELRLEKQSKILYKSELESHRELRKNKSDQDDLRKKDQYRSEPNDLIAKHRDQISKYKDNIRQYTLQNKDMKKQLKLMEQEKNIILEELGTQKADKIKIKEEYLRISGRLEDIEKQYRSQKQQKQKIQKQYSKYLNDQKKYHEEIKNMEDNLSSQAHELEQERKMAMQLQIKVKNKDLMIISLQKKIDEMEENLQRETDTYRQRKFDESGVLENNQLNRSMRVVQNQMTHQQTSQFQKQNSSYPAETYNEFQVAELRHNYQQLQLEYADLQHELNLIIQKQMIEVETQTDRDIVDFEEIGVGKLTIFIPCPNGMYIPLIMNQSLKTVCPATNVHSYKSCYFLNTDTFSIKTKDLLNQCSFILFAKVNSIQEKISEGQNQYGVKEGEVYYIVQVDKPEKMLGFEEEDDNSLKNYFFI